MIVRESVQFLLLPRTFNILSFYSKGHYALRVRLVAQDQQSGQIHKGFPALIDGKETQTDVRKKAKIDTQGCWFQTSHFYVTFSEQKIVFSSACLFKIEYQAGRKYSTRFQFELISTSFKKVMQGESAPQKIADFRTIHINNISKLNTFKRVLFDDSDYFSYSDVFLVAQPMGQKIRLHDFDFNKFHHMTIAQRLLVHHQTFSTAISLRQARDQVIQAKFGLTPIDFYLKMVGEKIVAYRKLVQEYQKYKFQLGGTNQGEETNFNPLKWISAQAPRSQAALLATYEADEVQELYTLIYDDCNLILRNIRNVWQKLVKLMVSASPKWMQQWASKDVRFEHETKAKWLINYSNICHEQREKMRQQFLSKRAQILRIMNVYEDTDRYHPFLIVENHQTEIVAKAQEIQSLVVFVHGYQGSSFDMQKARNFMKLYNGNAESLLIRSIQDDIDDSIQSLGKMIADEVQLHIKHCFNIYKKINFVGYSLGGILARQAVKHLRKYKHLMNLFITFASPHAGICDASNRLVRTGIWFLTNFDKNKNLKQLNCQKLEQESTIALQALSQCQSIGWFNRFIVVSSRQDGFVPYESSRLQEQTLGDTTKQICMNFKQRIRKLERVEVWFDVDHNCGTWDRLTGRKAHIQFLENRVFLDSFFAIYAPLL